jgi:hypothetical protein
MSEDLNPASLPIYQKAELIYQLVESLVASLPEDDGYIQSTKGFMRENALVMTVKIAGAEAGGLYSIKMQNAALIREHAMNLYVQVGSLRFIPSFEQPEYVTLIRAEIEAFKELFIDWVASFDKSDYIWDEWELFNPPGAVKGID